jgi:hypothetical protein
MIQPHVDQIDGGEIAGLMLPAFNPAMISNDALPPEDWDRIGLCQGISFQVVRQQFTLDVAGNSGSSASFAAR